MARAIAICVCEVCGNTFEKVAFKYNRREADSFEEWAKEACTVCPDCYRAGINEKNAKIASVYNLPEIDAVSDKQRAYADRLRNRFVAEYEDTVKLVRKFIEEANNEKFIKFCAKKGYDAQERFEKAIEPYSRKKAYICLTESNAAKIIDTFKCY